MRVCSEASAQAQLTVERRGRLEAARARVKREKAGVVVVGSAPVHRFPSFLAAPALGRRGNPVPSRAFAAPSAADAAP